MEAFPNIYSEPPKCFITNITYPKEFKALIFDIYMCFLEEKPDNILDFLIQYFENLKAHCETCKLSSLGPEGAITQYDELDENYFQTRRNAVFDETTTPNPILQIDVTPKSEEEKQYLIQVLKNIIFLEKLERKTINRLLDALELKKFYEGEHVIVEGEEVNTFYIVDYGRFAQVRRNEEGDYETVKMYKHPNYFGLQAFFHGRPAPLSIFTASEFGTLWALSRKQFREIMLNREHIKLMDYTSYINSRSVFYAFSEEERDKLLDILEVKYFDKETTIFREGDLSDGMYIIIKGKVHFSVMSNDIRSPREMAISRASQGAHFGELSLVHSCTRTLTAKTTEDTKALFINAETFRRLLPHRIKSVRKSTNIYPNPLFRMFQVDRIYDE